MTVEDAREPKATIRPGAWALGPDDRRQPAGRVLAMVLDAQMVDLRRHEHGVRDDLDPLHLHDYRVALRRARSLLWSGERVFPSTPYRELAASMATLAASTSDVRDLDVLIAAIDQRSGSISAQLDDGIQSLIAGLRLRRATRFAAMEHLLDGETYASMLRNWQLLGSVYRLGGDDPGPDALLATGEVVDAAVMGAFRRVRAAGRTAHASDELADWHELRKRLKRLRYVVVAFSPLYPDGSLEPVVRRLRRLQNVLGGLQDHTTEIDLIESVGAAMGGRAALAAGALSEQLHRATEQDLERCLGAWVRFDERRVRRSLREAVLAGSEPITATRPVASEMSGPRD